MTFKELQKVMDEYRLYKDRGVVRMVVASMLSNQLLGKNKKPVWIVFIAPPGGGKSDLTGTIADVMKYNEKSEKLDKLCVEISDLTKSSIASGMKTPGTDPSFLLTMNPKGGIMLFKDFTTILSKRKEEMSEIMSYLREIYDESFKKQFGNGKIVEFQGKVGLIASCTPVIYERLSDLSVLGDRMMYYEVEQPDRLALQEKIWENEDRGLDGNDEMKQAMTDYCQELLEYIETSDVIKTFTIDKETRNEFTLVANFTAIARSGVVWDYRETFVKTKPSPEMPGRILKQFIPLAHAMAVMNAKDTGKMLLTPNDRNIIYKIAFDSIPAQRRNLINIVAKYRLGVTITGLADNMGMAEQSIEKTMQELTSLGVVDRKYDRGSSKIKYYMREEFLPIIKKHQKIEDVDETLESVNPQESINGSFDALLGNMGNVPKDIF